MKIKRSDIDAAVAVEVMGRWLDECGIWMEQSGYVAIDSQLYSPSTDANHALEALEKWCVDNKHEADILLDGAEWDVDIQSEEESRCACCHETTLHGSSTNKSLTIAICLALLSAVRGEQVELED